ncbi:MAG: sulfite--cytochrome C oxidoreductase subunit B [Acidobacteriia bacterium]|nr:sulfite--cytochrome C oxidoreductase subunit B [Methyloceanibacter sp.]MCL6491897.1 sulfite--cytochrome C oxidoreductase subunit B [Terriglobia bacterium]
MLRMPAILFGLFAAATPVGAEEPKPVVPPVFVWATKSYDLPKREPIFEGFGAQLLNQHCLICHSAEFVDEQPPLPAATWRAEVLKMKNVFGAPVEDRDIPDLVEALTRRQRTMPNDGPVGNPGNGR